MSLNPDGKEKKIGFIYDTMTGFYSVMRNLQEDYKTYSKNYSEEALALLSRSDDFIEAVEAVRSLDSLSRIDDEGINELFLLSQQIAELYHLKVQRDEKTSEEAMEQEAPQISNKLDGKTDLFTLFVNEVSKEIGNVIHIDEGMRITFRLDALDKNAKYKTDWATKKESGTEEKSFYSLVSLIKNTADDDSMDREMTFEELGEYTVSAKVYKVMKQSLFASMKELVRDYEFKVVVDESDDLYATMDFWDKLFKALKDVNWKEVASASAEEVLKTLPVVVGTIILLSGVLIAISMTPVGLLTPMVGAAMQYFGVANGIKDIRAGLYLFTDAVIQVKEAKSSGAMKQASALFTKAFKYVGPNLLMDILMFFGGKAVKGIKNKNATKPKPKKAVTQKKIEAPKATSTTRKGKNGLIYKQDSKGKWHRPDGHYASNAELEQIGIKVQTRTSTKYVRNTSERTKFLLSIANDENSNLPPEIRKFILENKGKKVPSGYEVSHIVPLYTKIVSERHLLDIKENMELISKELHRNSHKFCGSTYHLFNPAKYKF